MMSTVEVICPSVVELTEEPRRNVPCTVEGCDKLLATTAALKMHVIKRHGIYKNKSERSLFSKYPQSKSPAVQKQYFCPVEGCSRHKNGNNPFPNMWPLKQHYQQVHGERNHLCRKCDFPFAFDNQRRKHEKRCGSVFTCSCGVPFTTRQALNMHAMRKKHDLPPHKQPTGSASPQRHKDSETAPEKEMNHEKGEPSTVSINGILTIPVPASQARVTPCLIITPQPLKIVETETSARKPSKGNLPRVERFLLPKPTILSVARAAALHPKTTQIVTINKGIVRSFPVSTAPHQPVKKHKRTLATQTPRTSGTQGSKWAPGKRKGSKQGSVDQASQLRGDSSYSNQRVFRDLGINTQLNSSIACQTQTVLQQSSAHTQTPGDVIVQEALMLAHVDPPTRKQQQVQLPRQHQHQQVLQQQQLQQGIPAFNRYTQTSQPSHQNAPASLSNHISSVNHMQAQQPHYTAQTQTQFNTNTMSSCDVQTESWLTSLVPVNDQGTLTDVIGVPTQTDPTFLDFLNLSNSETQTVISQSTLEESSATESISTQTSRYPANTTQTETSIQTTLPQIQGSGMERIAPQSTMETQTNFYSAYLDAFLLNESQSQTSPGQSLNEDMASCCQQTQTLASSHPPTDHQQTQTPLPDLSLSNSDFLSLDMYTQTGQHGLENRNTSLQTQTDPFLEYSLTSMQTQTMADFDLGPFDYQSISVQTDSRLLNNSMDRLTNRTQVHTQTSSNWRLAAGSIAARDVQTETGHSEELYRFSMCTSAVTDSHTQTG